jgi:hypothetical protein
MAKCSLTISAHVHAPSMSLDTMHGVCAAALTGSHSGWALVVQEPLWETLLLSIMINTWLQLYKCLVPTYKLVSFGYWGTIMTNIGRYLVP